MEKVKAKECPSMAKAVAGEEGVKVKEPVKVDTNMAAVTEVDSVSEDFLLELEDSEGSDSEEQEEGVEDTVEEGVKGMAEVVVIKDENTVASKE